MTSWTLHKLGSFVTPETSDMEAKVENIPAFNGVYLRSVSVGIVQWDNKANIAATERIQSDICREEVVAICISSENAGGLIKVIAWRAIALGAKFLGSFRLWVWKPWKQRLANHIFTLKKSKPLRLDRISQAQRLCANLMGWKHWAGNATKQFEHRENLQFKPLKKGQNCPF